MDQPADLHPPTSVRFGTILVRWLTMAFHRSAAAVYWLCAHVLPRLTRWVARELPWPSSAALRRLALGTAQLLGLLLLLLVWVVATAAPAYGARLALEADLWNLARYVEGPRPDVSSNGVALVMASILVLAGLLFHRDHDAW